MAWLYVPDVDESSVCAAGAAASNSESESPIRQPDAFVMWRGKLARPHSLFDDKRKRYCVAALSGLTSDHSTLALGMERWIASLGGCPASPGPSPEDGSERTILDISGLTPETSSNASNLPDASSKTSLGCYRWDLKSSQQTYKQWVTRLQRACSRRKKWVQATNAIDSSSWPTPSVDTGGQSLPPDMTWKGWTAAYKPNGDKIQVGLKTAVRAWSTPRASDGEKGGPNMSFGAGGIPLPTQAVQFSLQDPTTSTDGVICSQEKRTLNPLFVEHLMGWPIGWTAFEPAETEWSHWSRLMLGEFSRLVSRFERYLEAQSQTRPKRVRRKKSEECLV